MNIGERMKQRRKQLKLTADEVAEKIGVSRSNVYRYEKGDIEKLPLEVLEPLSEILKTTPQQLMGWDKGDDILPIYNQLETIRQKKVYNFAEHQLEEQRSQSVNVYGQTAAGQALEYDQSTIEEEKVSYVPKGTDGALVVRGDSMEPVLKNNELLFFKKVPQVENGDIAVVEIEGSAVTTKKVKYDYENEKIILQSLNDKYDDMVFENEEIRILGKVLL